MDAVFPFGFPSATAFYLAVYVLTLAVHVVFMNYVLAGSAIVAGSALMRRDERVVRVLKDWLPVMLSGAITAGVAPLLFIQILYKQAFYTANLLLFHRWMLILPVLIVGFYALYLMKSGWLSRRRGWARAAVTAVPFATIAFVGYSWTENHLLSLRDRAYWVDFYAGDRPVHTEPQLVPRLLVWACGSVPTLAALLAWQAWYRGWHDERKGLARLAFAGFALTGAASLIYWLAAPEQVSAISSPMALPYFIAACAGLVIQAGSWAAVWRAGLSTRALTVISIGLAMTIVGMTVCREAVRLQAVGADAFERLYPLHRDAAAKGGLPIFVSFLVLNAGLIGLCFVLVRRGTRAA
ncbi:MAG TPA: hypothetical protein VKD90_08645 [Gemmataceae bacterium]|nr:hypothetical protein [Gemmataceae bacterium]